MAIDINQANFKMFSDFVATAKSEDARAWLAKGDGGEEKRVVASKASNRFGALFRSQNSIDANNEVRKLFKETIADMFGGEEKIPETVKNAMKFEDFGKGKPLTARRIKAVQDAMLAILNANYAYKQIFTGHKDDMLGKLPREIQDAFKDAKEKAVARVGAEIIPNDRKFMQAIDADTLTDFLDNLDHVANGDDFKKVIADCFSRSSNLEKQVLLASVKKSVSNSGFKNVSTTLQLSAALMNKITGLKQDLEACQNPDDFAKVIAKYQKEIDAHLKMCAVSGTYIKDQLPNLVREKLKTPGLPNFTEAQIETIQKLIKDAAKKTVDGAIFSGKISPKSEKDVDSLYKFCVESFIQNRKNLGVETKKNDFKIIDTVVLQDIGKNAFLADKPENYRVTEGLTKGLELDTSKFENAIKNAKSITEEINAVRDFCKYCGENISLSVRDDKTGKQVDTPLRQVAPDDRQQVVGLIIKAAFSNKHDVVKKLANDRNEMTAKLEREDDSNDDKFMFGILGAELLAAFRELGVVLQDGNRITGIKEEADLNSADLEMLRAKG